MTKSGANWPSRESEARPGGDHSHGPPVPPGPGPGQPGRPQWERLDCQDHIPALAVYLLSCAWERTANRRSVVSNEKGKAEAELKLTLERKWPNLAEMRLQL